MGVDRTSGLNCEIQDRNETCLEAVFGEVVGKLLIKTIILINFISEHADHFTHTGIHVATDTIMSHPIQAPLHHGLVPSAHHCPPALVRVPSLRGTAPADDGELFVHETLALFDALEDAWPGLTSADASPFQTYAWNIAWYGGYATGGFRPLVFELRRDGVTVAILPCYRDGRTVRLAGDRLCGYQDAIARNREDIASLLRRVRAWLDHEGRGCHFRFEPLSEEGALHAVLRDPGSLSPGSLRFEMPRALCRCAELHGGLDGYLASLPRKRRSDLRHALNRLDRELPGTQVSILRDAEAGIDDLWHAAAFHVAHSRKEEESPFHDHRLIDLLARVAKDPDVGFQLAFLMSHGEVLAVDFGFVRGGRYYGYLGAYDRTYARLAPGKCLLLKRIDRWVAEDGVRMLDVSEEDAGGGSGVVGDRFYRLWSMRLMPDDLRHRLRQAGLESDKHLRRIARKALGMGDGLPR